MLLSPPMPLPFSLRSMDPAIRLEQRKVLKGPDPPWSLSENEYGESCLCFSCTDMGLDMEDGP